VQQRSLSLGILLASALSLAACSSGAGRSFLALEDEKAEARASIAQKIGVTPLDVRQALDSSPEQQRATALAVTQRVEQRYGVSSDLAMQQYLQDMAQRMADASVRKHVPVEVVLLKSRQINAFTPGAGVILINEGLLKITENEAQVAAVIAHELAHLLMRHPQRQKQIKLASKAGGVFMDVYTPTNLRENIGRWLRIGGNATMNGMIRQQEMMADSIGIDIMVKAGYDPREMAHVLRGLRNGIPEKNRAENVVVGNHPLTIDRERAAVEKINEQYRRVRGVRSTPEFDTMLVPYHLKRMKRLAER
jgi:predicted Zn-dependent protease